MAHAGGGLGDGGVHRVVSGGVLPALGLGSAVAARGGGAGGSFIGTVHDHQGCPPGQIAIGVHGSSGSMLDAVGLICATPPAHRTPPANAVSAIGRVPSPSSLPADPHRSICDAAASARARNSPAAPDLEEQCNAWKAQTKAQTTARDALIAVNEKKGLAPGPSGAPVSVCDAAQAALNRNA